FTGNIGFFAHFVVPCCSILERYQAKRRLSNGFATTRNNTGFCRSTKPQAGLLSTEAAPGRTGNVDLPARRRWDCLRFQSKSGGKCSTLGRFAANITQRVLIIKCRPKTSEL